MNNLLKRTFTSIPIFIILYGAIINQHILILLLTIIGFFVMLKKNKNNGLIFLLTLSIIYFISVSSWTGNNRYNVPNLIFMSFFIVEGFNYLFGKFFKKNDY